MQQVVIMGMPFFKFSTFSVVTCGIKGLKSFWEPEALLLPPLSDFHTFPSSA
jgi:hypothetical protein